MSKTGRVNLSAAEIISALLQALSIRTPKERRRVGNRSLPNRSRCQGGGGVTPVMRQRLLLPAHSASLLNMVRKLRVTEMGRKQPEPENLIGICPDMTHNSPARSPAARSAFPANEEFEPMPC